MWSLKYCTGSNLINFIHNTLYLVINFYKTIDDTYMAFRTLLGETIDGKEDMFIPHSFTINVVYLLFRRTDPFNLLIKNYEEKQDKMMEKQEERFKK